MEAMRIFSALKIHPRRSIRVGLWTGEEQGLLGSKAYVTRHFGYYTNLAASTGLRSPKDHDPEAPAPSASTNALPRKLVRRAEFENLSAYFNLDNGAGKIRGIYMQGNEAVRPLFRRWLEPFADLGAETLTLGNTGGTDHASFDAIGLPGFQFIQDPIDYWTRTHHSNQDLYDRVPPDDLRQAATILAAFVYDAAMADNKLPRKDLEL
jgi:Zn-dependent M28 family amino/carboxypeptidase